MVRKNVKQYLALLTISVNGNITNVIRVIEINVSIFVLSKLNKRLILFLLHMVLSRKLIYQKLIYFKSARNIKYPTVLSRIFTVNSNLK